MKIYIVEDKYAEIKKAQEAIRANNHEVGIPKNVLEGSIESFNDINWKEGRNLRDPISAQCANEELFAIIRDAKDNGGGIITDMMFHLAVKLTDEPTPPSGILVVLQAISSGVPVVVCTDASEVGGHHAKALHWIFDGYIVPARMNGIEIPFGWVENKDWDAAVKLLEQFHAKQHKKEVIE
ncbi:MAG: hypothetical protein UY41_C0007G0007 [Candidatus Moranbacteria bacterium GW2011_GWE1_49_15]|nr:MAG: hypothetical protein UX75_C0009G0020 [Candidatus Moranbacteria bacterium GW2011_GWE2_47_10]KKW07235.1 MAG: hypothetical protein UY41_C0007G0007 [Candidatus Moranbacteria bacterium GW2011_GWE1_49_15]HBP01569.1 hypothetical protein [Candidatus Moranbacteria bacterium]